MDSKGKQIKLIPEIFKNVFLIIYFIENHLLK